MRLPWGLTSSAAQTHNTHRKLAHMELHSDKT